MMWLTWRQFRAQSIAAAAALVVLAVVFAVTGPQLAHLYDTSGLTGCAARGDCGALASDFINQLKSGRTYQLLFYLGIGVMYVTPALIGVFWGAPLVTREIEAGTLRLAWSQSITPGRWIAAKLGLLGLAAMAITGLFSLMVGWWGSPIDTAIGIGSSNGQQAFSGFGRLDPLVFAARGVAPIGYAAFGFALGVAAGILIRRTVPAMATTLAVFTLVQIAWPTWVRPYLIPPAHASGMLTAASINELSIQNNSTITVMGDVVQRPGAWVLSNQTITPAGHVFTGPVPASCVSSNDSFSACQGAVLRLHLRELLTYQPASRFWAFQWYEAAIFLVIAGLLAGLSAWWVRRRRIG
jgi:hypothetical protein